MAALMKNADFRRQFVLTFLDMANENFRAERVLSLLDEIEAEYTAWAVASWERWNANPQDKTFAEQLEELRVFFENRFDYIVPCLAEHFGLTGSLAALFLSADTGEDDPDGASVPISLNTLSLELGGAESWQGQYYTDYPVTLTAQESRRPGIRPLGGRRRRHHGGQRKHPFHSGAAKWRYPDSRCIRIISAAFCP